jgi:hypothetical protein
MPSSNSLVFIAIKQKANEILLLGSHVDSLHKNITCREAAHLFKISYCTSLQKPKVGASVASTSEIRASTSQIRASSMWLLLIIGN